MNRRTLSLHKFNFSHFNPSEKTDEFLSASSDSRTWEFSYSLCAVWPPSWSTTQIMCKFRYRKSGEKNYKNFKFGKKKFSGQAKRSSSPTENMTLTQWKFLEANYLMQNLTSITSSKSWVPLFLLSISFPNIYELGFWVSSLYVQYFLADPPLVGSALDLHLSVCLCVCVCVRHQLTKLLISFILDEISLWNLLETYPGCLYTSFK